MAIAAAIQDSETQAREQLASLIQAGIMAGEWPPDPVLLARLITASLHGMMAQWQPARSLGTPSPTRWPSLMPRVLVR